MINSLIDSEKKFYSVLVYSHEYSRTINDSDICFRITDAQFLEVLLLKIRGETVKFASRVKKQLDTKEKELISDIESLENLGTVSSGDLLDDKKRELQDMREQKLNGQIIRSRAKWLHNGEKPSKFFCALESFNYTEKTVKRIKTASGYIVDQKEILNELKCFYQKLFEKTTELPNNIDFSVLLGNKNDIDKLSHEESLQLEGPLKIDELGIALKLMKTGKSTGIDGFPAEFF